MSATAKGVPYPEEADPNDVPTALQALAEWLDAHAGVSTFTTAERDVLVGADIWAGRVIYNASNQRLEVNKTGTAGAANWSQVDLVDAAAATASFRTLGPGATQAAAGNHGHVVADLPIAASGESSAAKVPLANDARLSNARVPVAHGHAQSDIAGLAAALAALAPLANPAFAGNPTAITQPAGDSSTKLATTEFVARALGVPGSGGVKIGSLLLQWGSATVSGAAVGAGVLATQAINWPASFSAAPWFATASVSGFVSNSSGITPKGVDSLTATTGRVIFLNTSDAAATFTNLPFTWIAIGPA